MNIFKYSKLTSKSGAVVNYTRQDLTTKWINRVSSKAPNAAAQDAVSKLSSIVAYYCRPAETTKDKIDWNYWKQNIRTTGVVDKLHDKLEVSKGKTYNVEAVAAKAANTTPKYESVGLYLKYNHDLWMKQYVDNLDALYNAQSIGDFSKIGTSELFQYCQGASELSAGWRETGYMFRQSVYYENSITLAVSNQFRYTNSSLQPYYHPVCAWERGMVCKHALMSL